MSKSDYNQKSMRIYRALFKLYQTHPKEFIMELNDIIRAMPVRDRERIIK